MNIEPPEPEKITKEECVQRYKEAEALFREGRKTEALQKLNQLNRAWPNEPDILYAVALVRKALRHTADVENIARRLTREFKDPRGEALLAQLEKDKSEARPY